jgi:iron-desferrioxamine transport system substrate-binding protein
MYNRRLRFCSLLLGGVVVLGACGRGDSQAESAGSAESAGWSYVDGSGTETTLDEVPTRIVAHGSAAAALMSFGIRPVGIYADEPVDTDLALRDLDLDGIEIVGQEWGVVNVEAVAALQPDLIVAEWWPVEEAYSGLEDAASTDPEVVRAIAPIVGVTQGPSIVEMIEDYAELAERLGADLDDPTIAEARDRFESAVADFQDTVESKPDLSVLAVSPTPESLYVAVPDQAAELADFTDWGLGLVVPDNPDPGFEYWETLSWENADKYQADLLIVDERGYPANLEDAERRPTWQALDAADTGAVAVWPAYWVRTYDDYAGALEDLTASIEGADEHLVP